MLGNLFYRGQKIETLNGSKFSELQYWNEWHIAMAKHTDTVTEQIRREMNG